MNFHRINIEITNICGLSCTFCPPKTQATKTMSLEFFTQTIKQLKVYTKTLAFHMMGDPLTLSNLKEYLDLAHKEGFEVELTTSGYHLAKTQIETLFHPCVRQLNISLNSFNKNSIKLSFDDYINTILEVCSQKIEKFPQPFINLRLWNLDDSCSESEFNFILFERISSFFEIELDIDELYKTRPKSIRIAPKVLLNFDSYFQWPSLDSIHDSDATCHGLKSHIGILANGNVVPCCLDGDGIINLGNLYEIPLQNILNSSRVQTIKEGFKKSIAVEELCRKCSYKDRFNDAL